MIGLASNKGQKTGSLSGLAILQANARQEDFPNRRAIQVKNVFTCHENDSHILDHVSFAFCSEF